MNTDTIRTEVVTFIEKKGGPIADNPDEQLACQYLDAGLVDSMGIVEMIAEFEEKFQIQFTAEDLQSPDFQTVGGLVSIIEARLNG